MTEAPNAAAIPEGEPANVEVTLIEAVRIAQDWQRAGRLADAAALYGQILEKDPEQPEALHFLGLLLHQLGHEPQAIDHLRRALAAQPDYPDARCNLGNMLQEMGDLEGAERCYREVLATHPDFVGALNNLGILLQRLERFDDAERTYRRALELAPDQALIHGNLGRLALERGAIAEAIAACELAIRQAPGFAEAHRTLAQALLADHRPEEAGAASRRALDLGADAYEQLGVALRNQGMIDEAIQAFRRVAQTGRDNAIYNLGMLLRVAGRLDEAAQVYRDWLANDPDNPVARHMLAAWTDDRSAQRHTPARASDRYVATIFDSFAAGFDRQLAKLEYCAPTLAVAMLGECQGPPQAALRILDAGCGTGLGAALLRPFAATLSGVDLSPGMLDRARERGLYDDLACAELTDYLARHAAAFDTVVSVDTLVYFGDLQPPLIAAARALAPAGYLILTLERAPDEIPGGFQLEITGRYIHAPAYVRGLLDKLGFGDIRIREAVPRLERGEPVAGLVVAARRT